MTTIQVFGTTERSRSMDRYARELAQNFPPDIHGQFCCFTASRNALIRNYDRYWGYLRFAQRHQGDYNILASEAVAYLVQRLPRQRTICVCHDVHPLLVPGPRNLTLRAYIERYRWSLRYLHQVKLIVTVSESTRRRLLEAIPSLPAERVVPVLSGIEKVWRRIPQSVADAQRVRFGLDGRRVVLHVGNDVWYKNLACALRAFTILNDPETVFVHVGRLGEENRRLAAALGARFRQFDDLEDEQLLLLYNLAAVFVFPSLSEGFGWPPLEAMACGCPVISSDRASLPEVCGDASHYIDAENPEQVAAAMSAVLSDGVLRQDLIARGLVQAMKFDWKKTAARIAELARS